MKGESKKDASHVRFIKLLLKFAVTVFCFWYISQKIDFEKTFRALTQANWLYLFFALVFFVLSKMLSALRLNINFRNIGLHLPAHANMKLYWLGMFYNLFLPGAISGDAYKIILIKRSFHSDYRKTAAAVLLDRFSGVLALGFILTAYGLLVLENKFYESILLMGTLSAMIVFYIVVRYFLKDFLPGFVTTFLWGLAVQGSQVLCVYLILLSVNIPLHQHQWIFIFLASAVISVLPISLGGGLGTREVVFAEGARFLHLDPQMGIIISLLFYLITVTGSVWGVYYSFHDPLKNVQIPAAGTQVIQ